MFVLLAMVLAACGAPNAEAPTPTTEPRGAPTLAATLPRELGGVEVQIYSMRGPEFVASADADPALLDFLGRLDAELEQVSAAFGFLAEPQVDLLALRVQGVGQQRLSREFRAVPSLPDVPHIAWAGQTVGGKQVLVAASQDPDQGMYYLYVLRDTLYLVATPLPDLAAEALHGLP
jgi:hypothetical protein